MSTLVAARMRAQRLAGASFTSAIDAVRHFGAVQSQDYAAAKWALAQRMGGDVTDAELDRLFDSGAILRTHVLRPTWHFVLPQDIRWMLELTAPRIHAGDAGRRRELGIDAAMIKAAQAGWRRALEGGRTATKDELGQALAGAGITVDTPQLLHLGMAAELDGVLVSGPRRGRLTTWMLLDERVAQTARRDRDDALRELAVRYFTSHGPAQLRDYAWWSGLAQAEARRGIELAGSDLSRRTVGGKEYWFDASLEWRAAGRGAVHLLPNFDEYTVGYRDRSAILHPAHPFRPELFAFSSILSNIVTAGGELRAAWRRVNTARGVRIEVRPVAVMSAAERAGAERAAARMGAFLGRPVQVAWPRG